MKISSTECQEEDPAKTVEQSSMFSIILQRKKTAADVCGGELILRDDDKAETVKKRLDVYHEQTAPLIAHYKEAGSLHEIDGTQDIKVVFEEIKSILG